MDWFFMVFGRPSLSGIISALITVMGKFFWTLVSFWIAFR